MDTDYDEVSVEETLSRHRQILERYCKDKRINVVEILEEVVSGESLGARPEMMRLLDMVGTGMYAGVVCMDIERLSRGSSLESGHIMQVLQVNSCKIITPGKTYDLQNDSDEQFTDMKFMFSRYELKTINKRLVRGRNQSASEGKFMIGYDDLYSVQYFGENLRPYWNRTGDVTIESQFELANKEYRKLAKKATEFDYALMQEAIEAGGKKYAELCALAYRQAISAHKLVQTNEGFLTFLSKENNSNGSIGTVDVTYPSFPIFFKYNTKLARALMDHIFHYSESGRWTKPFPAHDVGTYPLANGQTYKYDMPVEEAGNMLVGAAAVCAYENSTEYAKAHWDVMTTWVDYLC